MAATRSSWRAPWLLTTIAVDAVLDGETGVLGGQDPLEHERQGGPRSDRGEVAPRQARPEPVVDPERGARVVAVGRAGVAEVAERRELEPGPTIAVAVAEDRQVDGQDDRAVPGGRGSLDERPRRRRRRAWT